MQFSKVTNYPKPNFLPLDDSTLSKSMTILASKNKRETDISRCIKSKSRNEISKSHHNDTESDTSVSPINEFSNMSTYRVPTKSRGGKRKSMLFVDQKSE